MEIDILEKKDNPLLRRTEIIADISFEAATPSRQVMKEAISKKLNASPELIIIRNIYPFFGDKKAEVVVHIYNKKEDVEKIESNVYIQRMLGKKKEEKKEEKPVEEKPAEEKKEAKAEEKKPKESKEKPEEKSKEEKKQE